MKKQMSIGILACLVFGSTLVFGAPLASDSSDDPVEITADEMDYNWKDGNITANGNVVAIQKGDRLQGDRLEYDTNTSSGSVIGNVIGTRTDGSKLITARLDLTNGVIYTGSGGVNYTSPENSLQAPWLQYNTETGYIRTEGRTTMTRPDGTMRANQVEGWEKEQKMIGRGNVDFASETHQAVGKADRIDYDKGNNDQGTIVLTGNAQLVQKGGNMITGPKITMDLDTGYAQAEGRPTLVITPQK